jgi:hypothetical protein
MKTAPTTHCTSLSRRSKTQRSIRTLISITMEARDNIKISPGIPSTESKTRTPTLELLARRNAQPSNVALMANAPDRGRLLAAKEWIAWSIRWTFLLHGLVLDPAWSPLLVRGIWTASEIGSVLVIHHMPVQGAVVWRVVWYGRRHSCISEDSRWIVLYFL